MMERGIFYVIVNQNGEFYQYVENGVVHFGTCHPEDDMCRFRTKEDAVEGLKCLKHRYPEDFKGAVIKILIVSLKQIVEMTVYDEFSKFIDLRELKIIPADVINNSNYLIPLHGELEDGKNIIVITRLGRQLFEAHVCTLSYGKASLGIEGKGEYLLETPYIDDIPGYPTMIMGDLINISVKTIGGVQYTMVCKDDVDKEYCRPNWLW